MNYSKKGIFKLFSKSSAILFDKGGLEKKYCNRATAT